MQAQTMALVGIIAVLTTGFSDTIQVTTDYDRNVSFANYHTFFIIKGSSSGTPLLDQRVMDDVRDALTTKGWEGVSEGEGRTAVVVHTATATKHSCEAFYEGWGGWKWGGGTAATCRDPFKVGSVLVDMFDAATKQLIWRGAVSDALTRNAEQKPSITREAITKLFHRFPPGHEVGQ
ncbi:MAG TPA: DUF4136 domain-containing protein [Vicinamibacterales bacterium]|nr:DUF4136 domain-containing protein [Vicinamibacterales bacterium]